MLKSHSKGNFIPRLLGPRIRDLVDGIVFIIEFIVIETLLYWNTVNAPFEETIGFFSEKILLRGLIWNKFVYW